MLKNTILFGTLFALLIACTETRQLPAGFYIAEPTPEQIHERLKYPNELKKYLTRENLPFPEGFAKVAILESGWSLSLCPNNNLFGFRCSDWAGVQCCEWGHSGFRYRQDAVTALKEWVKWNPPLHGEDFYSYLRRRGYNTENPNYYQLLTQIPI